MENKLNDKDIEVLNKWAEEYDIDELKIKDKEKIFNLEELYIGCDNLKQLPEEIQNLINLEYLYIHSSNLPKKIVGLTNLKELRISCDNSKKLPEEVGN